MLYTFYLGGLLDHIQEKNYYNGYLIIKIRRIAHFSCPIDLLLIAAVSQIKDFAFPYSARMAKNRFAPHDCIAPPSLMGFDAYSNGVLMLPI